MNRGTLVPFTRVSRTIAAIFALVFMVQTNASAMVINITYDSSITSLGNAAQVEGAISNAANVFDVLYTNNIVVNITAFFDSTIDLGQSTTLETGNPTYSEVTNFLRAARTTAADSNSVASLPAIDPTGGSALWWLPRAEAKALGGVLGVTTNSSSPDGSVYFASTVTYSLNPTNRGVTGQYDLTAVAEHEISEVLGRGFGLNYQGSGFIPYDLFRFTNNGAHNFSVSATNVYFSVNNGASNLANFFGDVISGDIQDWATHTPADSFDAFLTDGQEGYLSYADLTALDILGYALNFHAPKLTAIRNASGKIQLNFTNVTGLDFSILSSTNIALPLTNWPVLGRPIETSVGNYQFTDSNTNKTRFYRAVLN